MARPSSSSWKLAVALLAAGAVVDACSAPDPTEATTSTSQPAIVSNDLVISQVYGAGGNSGATYKNDFVEIFNRGSVAVQLSGYSIQYASSTGPFNTTNSGAYDLPSFSLQPGQYYLIQLAGGSNGVAFPVAADTSTTSINMSGTTGKVALVLSGSKLNGCGSTATPCTPGGWVDLVGFGAASQYEGSNPSAAISTTTAAFRASGGCVDTGDNAADFSVLTVLPRSSVSSLNVCATDAGSDAAADASDADPDALADGAIDALADVDDGGIIVVDAGVDADDGGTILDASVDVDDGGIIVIDASVDADDGGIIVIDAGLDADDGGSIVDATADVDDGGSIVDATADVDDGGSIVDATVDADDGGSIVDATVDADDGGIIVTDGGPADSSVIEAGPDAALDAGADAASDASADADTDAASDAAADAAADAAMDATTDASPSDAAADAKPDAPAPDAAVDATTDAGEDPGTVGGGGCTCNESGRPSSNAGALALTLAVAVVLRRRRRG